MQSELSKTLEAAANAEAFMKVVRKYTSFEELTPTLLREFVEKTAKFFTLLLLLYIT